jgi:polysaccharide pyruvyl transferase WcaK-like protein
MRIIFDTCVYDMRNKGNVAMLQIAIERLHQFWPEADLCVISISPHILRLYCPSAHPISPEGREWDSSDKMLDRIMASLPVAFLRILFELREAIWYYLPSLLSKFRRIKKPSVNSESENPRRSDDIECSASGYGELLRNTDLYIATGSQYMSDACQPDALKILDRLKEAHESGIPTVMVGQGVGPICDRELVHRAREVLPLIDLLFVRETLTAPRLLESLGVAPERIVFTGDDALELAFRIRTKLFGNSIGISVRVADYTEVGNLQLELLRDALDKVRNKYNAPFVALPISHTTNELDDKVIRQFYVKDGLVDFRRFDSPVDIIKKTGRCRLVVTGTYHGAVFALAQGIPVIGVVKSEMYVDKFKGLAEEYGEGCQIIHLDDPNFIENMSAIVDLLWDRAEEFRPHLLASTERQIKLGRTAYEKIYDLELSKKGN